MSRHHSLDENYTPNLADEVSAVGVGDNNNDNNNNNNNNNNDDNNLEPTPKEPAKNSSCFIFSIICEIFLIIIAIALIIQIFITSDEIDKMIGSQLKEKFVMSAEKQQENGSNYQHWISNTFDDSGVQIFRYYIFNITNPDNVSQGGTPQLKEVGPFVYRRYEYKRDPVFSNDSTTVSYTYEFSFEYLPEESTNETDKDNDYVYVINPALLTFIYYKYCEPTADWLADFFVLLPSSDVFYHATPDQLLWYIHDENIEGGLGFPSNSTQYHLVNDASFDVSEYTGVGNLSRMRELISYYNHTSIDFWQVPEEIEGSRENRLWKYQWLTRSKNLSVYAIEKYRVVNYVYSEDVTDDDLKLYRYKVENSVFYNSTNYPKNINYDQNGYDGLLNLTNRKPPFRTPAYVSKSYFLDAEYYVNEVNRKMGLRDPDRSIDDTYFDIEPTTGAVIHNYLAFQLSFQLRPLNITFSDGNVTLADLIVPFANEVVYAYAPNSVVNDLSTQLETASLYKKLSIYGGPCLAFVFIVIACWLFYKRYKKKNTEPISNTQLKKTKIPDNERIDNNGEGEDEDNIDNMASPKSMTSKFGTPSQNKNIDTNKVLSNHPLLNKTNSQNKSTDGNYSSV